MADMRAAVEALMDSNYCNFGQWQRFDSSDGGDDEILG